jgi:hypothetical protein
MRAAALNEQQGTGPQTVPPPIHSRSSFSREHVKPLIAAPVPVVGSALSVPWREQHCGGLSACVFQGHPEAFAKPELLLWHLGYLDAGLLSGSSEMLVLSPDVLRISCGPSCQPAHNPLFHPARARTSLRFLSGAHARDTAGPSAASAG